MLQLHWAHTDLCKTNDGVLLSSGSYNRPECECEHSQVDVLLESIPKMFASTQVADSCAGAAIQAAVEALQVRAASLSWPMVAG